MKIPAYKRFFRTLSILVSNLIFFPFRLKKSRDLINHIYQFNPYPNVINKNILEVELEDIFPEIYSNEIVLKDLESKYGSMTLDEIYNVTLLVKQLNPKFIFEYGTFIGVTTLQMALNTDNDAKIYTLNLPSKEETTKFTIGDSEEEKNLPELQPGNRFENSYTGKKITQLYGDSAVFDYTRFYNSMDLILVDASHEYDYVKSDTINAYKMIKQAGTIIWHDYPNAPGVYRFLNEISGKIKIFHLKDTHIAITIKADRNIIPN